MPKKKDTTQYRLKKEPFRSHVKDKSVEYVAVMDFKEFKAGDTVALRYVHSMRSLYAKNRIGIKGDTWTKISLEKFAEGGANAVKPSYMVDNPIPGRVTAVSRNRKRRLQEAAETAAKEKREKEQTLKLTSFQNDFMKVLDDALGRGDITASQNKALKNKANGEASKDIYKNLDIVDDFIANCEDAFAKSKKEKKDAEPPRTIGKKVAAAVKKVVKPKPKTPAKDKKQGDDK